MLLCHRMINRDEMLILNLLDMDAVVSIHILSFQWRQGDAAAADYRVSGAVYDVSADGTDMEFAAEHIGRNVFVDNMLAVHQFDHGDIQRLCQWLQQGNIRQSLGGFPLGDGLAADTDLFTQLGLGQIPLFTKLFDGGACYIGIHP